MRLFVAGGLGLALSLGIGAPASGAERSTTAMVDGPWCGSASYSVALPPRAIRIRTTPARKAALHDGEGKHVGRVSSVRGIRKGSRRVTWRLSFNCTSVWVNDGLMEQPIVPWEQTLSARFRVLPRRATLGAGQAHTITARALSRRFANAYRHGYGHRISCTQRLHRSTRRCKASWIVGDVVYFGSTRATLLRRPNLRLVTRVRFRIRRFDEYCWYVLDRTRAQCTRTYRGRMRVR